MRIKARDGKELYQLKFLLSFDTNNHFQRNINNKCVYFKLVLSIALMNQREVDIS